MRNWRVAAAMLVVVPIAAVPTSTAGAAPTAKASDAKAVTSTFTRQGVQVTQVRIGDTIVRSFGTAGVPKGEGLEGRANK